MAIIMVDFIYHAYIRSFTTHIYVLDAPHIERMKMKNAYPCINFILFLF